MKKQMKFMASLLFLLLVPVFAGYTLPQSFYISSGGGQAIKNRDIQRMYCLEYSKDALMASNLAELTRITGDVRVIYKNGSQRVTALNELLNSGVIRLVPLNSYESLRFVFLDENIAEIRIGEDGITLFREEMKPNEEKLAEVNIEKIKELEARGKSHAEVQETIWRTKTGDWIIWEDKRHVYDFMTTEEEKDKVHSGFVDFTPLGTHH